jgi:NitT/TauT family transport system permease protein
VLFGAALIGVWQLIITLGIVEELVLPTPADTASDLWAVIKEMASGGDLLRDLWVTVQETALGFVIAAVSGFLFGVAVAETRFGREIVMPYLVWINALPKVAFAPVLVAWLGFGVLPKALMAAFIAFFPLIVVTATGLASTDRDAIMLMRSLRASRLTTLVKVKVPSAMPAVFAGLKTATVLSVTGAIVGEFLGGGDGLGGRVRTAASLLDMPRVFALIVILGVMALLFYGLLAALERKVVFWNAPDHGHGGPNMGA